VVELREKGRAVCEDRAWDVKGRARVDIIAIIYVHQDTLENLFRTDFIFLISGFQCGR
jgi:hypothetical protein